MIPENAKMDIETKRILGEIKREIYARSPRPLHADSERYVKLLDVEMIFKKRIDELDERIKKKLNEGVTENE